MAYFPPGIVYRRPQAHVFAADAIESIGTLTVATAILLVVGSIPAITDRYLVVGIMVNDSFRPFSFNAFALCAKPVD